MEQQISIMENMVEWIDESQSILKVIFKGAWHWPEIHQVVVDVRARAATAPYSFHIIFDISQTRGILGPGMLMNMRQIIDNPVKGFSRNIGMVGANPELRSAEALLRRSFPRLMDPLHIYYVNNISEAVTLLKRL